MQWLFNSKPKIVCIHSSGSTTKITYHFTGWFVMRLCCLSYSWWWISPLAIVIVKFSSNNPLFQFTSELCILNHTALIPRGVFWKTLLLKNSHSIELGYTWSVEQRSKRSSTPICIRMSTQCWVWNVPARCISIIEAGAQSCACKMTSPWWSGWFS